jgi:hypothetical protein
LGGYYTFGEQTVEKYGTKYYFGSGSHVCLPGIPSEAATLDDLLKKGWYHRADIITLFD